MKAPYTLLAAIVGIAVLATGCASLRRAPARGSAQLLSRACDEVASISPDKKDACHMAYFKSVREVINTRWNYPPLALENKWEGQVILELVVLADGQLEEVRVINSSGHSALDDEAVRAVRAASPFQPFPSRIQKSRLKVVAKFEYVDDRWEEVTE